MSLCIGPPPDVTVGANCQQNIKCTSTGLPDVAAQAPFFMNTANRCVHYILIQIVSDEYVSQIKKGHIKHRFSTMIPLEMYYNFIHIIITSLLKLW